MTSSVKQSDEKTLEKVKTLERNDTGNLKHNIVVKNLNKGSDKIEKSPANKILKAQHTIGRTIKINM
jgi:hypothetical protein